MGVGGVHWPDSKGEGVPEGNTARGTFSQPSRKEFTWRPALSSGSFWRFVPAGLGSSQSISSCEAERVQPLDPELEGAGLDLGEADFIPLGLEEGRGPEGGGEEGGQGGQEGGVDVVFLGAVRGADDDGGDVRVQFSAGVLVTRMGLGRGRKGCRIC